MPDLNDLKGVVDKATDAAKKATDAAKKAGIDEKDIEKAKDKVLDVAKDLMDKKKD